MINSKQSTFLTLYRPVHADFERFCRARAYGDVPYQDLMNETLLVAYKKFDQLNHSESFLSFLIGITIKVLANANRKKRPITGMDEMIFHNMPDTSSPIDVKFEIEMLHKALAKLPELQKEALILFEITGYSIKEIMEIQQSGASAIKQRLLRGRKQLAKEVNKLMKIQGEASKKI